MSGNSAGSGGGGILNNNGTLTVTGSTVSGNSATRGGGVFSIINSNSDTEKTTITNSTISGNEAFSNGGGVHNENGLTVIENSTITKNTAPQGAGSGVASFGDNITRTRVFSSIIAANTNTDVDFVINSVNNSFQSNGHNLIGDGNVTENFTTTNNDQIIGDADPGLDLLADNGGPTDTHALLPGSPAFDRGTSAGLAAPATDQRGVPRPQNITEIANAPGGDGSDIGAFEARPVAATDPTSLDFGGIPVDERSEIRTVKVTNTGEVALEIERSEIVGENLSSFQKTGDTCFDPLAPGEECEIRIRFTPEESGAANAKLRIVSNDPNSPTRVSLTGTGTVAPAPAVDSINPADGEQGETIPVTITGSGFSNGASAYLVRGSVRLGVGNTNVNSGGGISGELAIPDGFPTGSYALVVENPDGKRGERAGAFTVENAPEPPPAPAPELASASPSTGERGETVILQIAGTNLDADTSIRLAKGRVVLWASSVAEDGSGGLRAEISIPADFPVGAYDVIAENPDAKSDTLAGAFEITAAPEPPASPAPNPLGCTVFGTPGNDNLAGTPGRDVICGLGGNDTIRRLGGNDVIYGGPGNDTIFGGAGNDLVYGGAGNDRIIGGPGRDRLFGQTGNDRLNARDGVRGNDVANGGAGRDTCASDVRDVRRNCP